MERILRKVARYYSEQASRHGATPRGVDWNSAESQACRFEQLCKILPETATEVSVLDFGCGYGSLVGFLDQTGHRYRYQGFDISSEQIALARGLYGDHPRCTFTEDADDLLVADFVLASGIFNVRGDVPEAEWGQYVDATLERLASLSTRGFAFNALTVYSDPERMRSDLWYADPLRLFDLCERRYSRWVALLHDYGLFEFTILVRRDERRSWQS